MDKDADAILHLRGLSRLCLHTCRYILEKLTKGLNVILQLFYRHLNFCVDCGSEPNPDLDPEAELTCRIQIRKISFWIQTNAISNTGTVVGNVFLKNDVFEKQAKIFLLSYKTVRINVKEDLKVFELLHLKNNLGNKKR